MRDTAVSLVAGVACAALLGPVATIGAAAAAPSTTSLAVAASSMSRTDAAWTSRPLTPAERAAMTPSVWRPGCPVSLDDIRRVTVRYVTYDGRERVGRIDVRADVADDVAAVFKALLTARFAVNSVRPVEAFGGDDGRSVDADNTSAFNCRAVTGGTRFSEHSYGTAVDLNPYRNPYVLNGRAKPRPGIAKYVTRDPKVANVGVIYRDGPAFAAFTRHGWKWGGDWTNPKDYQHFSVSGR